MYNFRARVRSTLPGSILAQGVRAHVLPAVASQVSPSQALEILDEIETVPETEMSGSAVSSSENQLLGSTETQSAGACANSPSKSESESQYNACAAAAPSDFALAFGLAKC